MEVTAIVIMLMLAVFAYMFFMDNLEKDQIIKNLRKWAKKSKNTYTSMYWKLKRRAGRIERLEKQIITGSIWKPVK